MPRPPNADLFQQLDLETERLPEKIKKLVEVRRRLETIMDDLRNSEVDQEQKRRDDLWEQLASPTDPMVIICPYCHLTNLEGQEFCCEDLRQALTDILESGKEA